MLFRSVRAKVGKGREVTITEETNYPFNGLITFTIDTDKPVKFPLELRIPGWADSVEIRYGKKVIVAKGKSSVKLKEKWKSGDKITMQIPMDLRFEKR